jgi:O-antigen ligase
MLARLPERLAAGALFFLLVLPWVQPFSSGPARNAWPWMMAAACFAAIVLLRRQLRPQLFVQALLTAALLSSAMAVLQYLGQAAVLAPWVWPVGPGEGFGNLRQRNQFASLTALGLAALLTWLATRSTGQAPALPAALSVAALALLAAGNAASQSRTGLLAWSGVALACAWYTWRHGRRGLPVAAAAAALPVLAALACAGAGCGAIGRFAQAGQDGRLALWRDVLYLIGERPWTGWGWGELGYAHFITLFPWPRWSEKLDNAHNLPLQLAVELGIPAALAVCAALLGLVWRARPWRETQPWRWGAWMGLGVIALHSLLEYPLWYGPFQIALVLCALFLWRSRPGVAPPAFSARSRLADLGAAGLLVLVLGLGLDYLRVSQPFLPPAQRSAWLSGDALQQAQGSWWYRAEADFATLALTPVNAGNAQTMNTLAEALLHHSAEPLVIDKLLDSAQLLGRSEQVAFYSRRYQAAYPQAHAAWLERHRPPATPAH